MIVSTDIEYIKTKKIKHGYDKLIAPFDTLADWISETYEVVVLNIIYDHVIPDSRPRLQVILEYNQDKDKFHDKSCYVNFDESKQIKIKNKFIEIINQDKSLQFDIERLFVVFSAFERIAIQEANSKISEQNLEKLKNDLQNNDIWIIRKSFGSATIFFFTNEQLKENKIKQKSFDKAYFDLIKKFDEFNYIKKFHILLDSKENFNNNYQGNWFYYDR